MRQFPESLSVERNRVLRVVVRESLRFLFVVSGFVVEIPAKNLFTKLPIVPRVQDVGVPHLVHGMRNGKFRERMLRVQDDESAVFLDQFERFFACFSEVLVEQVSNNRREVPGADHLLFTTVDCREHDFSFAKVRPSEITRIAPLYTR